MYIFLNNSVPPLLHVSRQKHIFAASPKIVRNETRNMFVHKVLHLFTSGPSRKSHVHKLSFFLHVHVANSAVANGPEGMPAFAPGSHAQHVLELIWFKRFVVIVFL